MMKVSLEPVTQWMVLSLQIFELIELAMNVSTHHALSIWKITEAILLFHVFIQLCLTQFVNHVLSFLKHFNRTRCKPREFACKSSNYFSRTKKKSHFIPLSTIFEQVNCIIPPLILVVIVQS